MKVSYYIVHQQWQIPSYISRKYPTLTVLIQNTTLCIEPQNDCLHWLHSMDGDLSNKLAYDFLNTNQVELVQVYLKCLCPHPPHTHTHTLGPSFVWRLAHHKLLTNDQLRIRGCILVSACCFCYMTAEHIIFNCSVTSQFWNWLSNNINQPLDLSSWDIPLHCS